MRLIKGAIIALFDFLQGIVVVLAVMVMIYLFIMSPQEINGASMEPNFHNGEYILTNKIIYRIEQPQRGDVIIFKSPRNKEVDYIKRIIGLPGDRVSVKSNAIYVNEEKVAEPYLQPGVTIFGMSYLKEGQEATVPEGMYFVLGDNRPHSSDSRDFGPIPKDEIIGKAFLRYWPFSEFGVVIRPVYNL